VGLKQGTRSPLGRPFTGEGAAGSSKAQFVSGNAQNVDQGVAVVGRGKKRGGADSHGPGPPQRRKASMLACTSIVVICWPLFLTMKH